MFLTDETQKEAGHNGLVGVWVIVRSRDPDTVQLRLGVWACLLDLLQLYQ